MTVTASPTATLTEQTPVEIDTALGDLYGRIYKVLGDRKGWVRHLADAESGLAKHLSGKFGGRYSCYTQESVDRCLGMIDGFDAQVAALETETLPFEAEFVRRGTWTRFFLVKNHGGHVHSSMSCSTCNNGRYATQFGWLPALSGLAEADAVKAQGAVLCTVCYPSAPVEWTDGRRSDDGDYCAGSGTWNYPADTARKGYCSGNYGVCEHCQGRITISSTGKMRKHKKPA